MDRTRIEHIAAAYHKCAEANVVLVIGRIYQNNFRWKTETGNNIYIDDQLWLISTDKSRVPKPGF